MTQQTASATHLAQSARALYHDASVPIRTLQSLRPYICPFGPLLDRIPLQGRMLDVGCGAGLFLGLVGEARPEVEALGFDADARVVAAAQAMAKSRFGDGRIVFRHLAVQEPWPAGPFDVVSIIDVLHHIPPAAQGDVIDQAWQHVAPGGILLYKDMADHALIPALWNRLHDLLMARQWIHYRALEDVERWLIERGAQIEAQSGQRLGLYQHEWLVARKPA